MKRWTIVNKQTLAIEAEYCFVTSQLGTGAFGGPWNDPAKVMHLPVPPALKDVPFSELICLFEDPGHQVDDCGCPLFNYVAGEIVDAYDSNGRPILNGAGSQVRVQKFVCEPRLGPVHFITRR